MCKFLTISILFIGFLTPSSALAQRRVFQHRHHHHHCSDCHSTSPAVPAQQDVSDTSVIVDPIVGNNPTDEFVIPVANTPVETPDGFVGLPLPSQPDVEQTQPLVFSSETTTTETIAQNEPTRATVAPLELPSLDREPQSWEGRLFPSDRYSVATVCVPTPVQKLAVVQPLVLTQKAETRTRVAQVKPQPRAETRTRVAEAKPQSRNQLAAQPTSQRWEGRLFDSEQANAFAATLGSQSSVADTKTATRHNKVAAKSSSKSKLGWLIPFGLFPLGWLGLALAKLRSPAKAVGHVQPAARSTVSNATAAVTGSNSFSGAASNVDTASATAAPAFRIAKPTPVEPVVTRQTNVVAASDSNGFAKGEFESHHLKNGSWQTTGQFATAAVGDAKPATPPVVPQPRRDDLTVVDGICGESQELLNQAGIYNYSDLAQSDAEQRRAALAVGGSRFRAKNSSDWSRQAKTFAVGAIGTAVTAIAVTRREDDEIETTESDELTEIEGISPAAQTLLNAGGINNFGDLANSDAEQRMSALAPGGSRFSAMDTSTWPRQASEILESRLPATVSIDSLETDELRIVSERTERVAERDDLTVIEGICPETEQLLNNAGVYTFADLSATDDIQRLNALAAGGSRFEWKETNRWTEKARELDANESASVLPLFDYIGDAEFNAAEATEGGSSRDRVDFTVIDGVTEEIQQAFYSADIEDFGDLAIADRVALESTLAEYDVNYDTFDIDACCDQAMGLVPEDFWQSATADRSYDDDGLQVLAEVNELNREMNYFKKMWSFVSDKAKRSRSVFAELVSETDVRQKS